MNALYDALGRCLPLTPGECEASPQDLPTPDRHVHGISERPLRLAITAGERPIHRGPPNPQPPRNRGRA